MGPGNGARLSGKGRPHLCPRILAFGLAIMVLGALITLISGEMGSEPWLVIIDIGQVAVAALLGAYALPFGLSRLRGIARSAPR